MTETFLSTDTKDFSFTVKDINRPQPKEDHKAVSVVHSALQALGYVLTANSWYSHSSVADSR